MTVRIGLTGAGRRAADAYAPALARCGQARFAGVWAPRLPAAECLASQHAVRAYHRFDDMLAGCDAVVLAVPPAAAPDLAEAAAGRSKAVLLESPIAADLAGAQRLARTSAGPAWRTEMGVLRSLGPYLIDLLDAALGPVGAVRAHGDPDGWLGLLLEHSAGRFSEASLTAVAAEGSDDVRRGVPHELDVRRGLHLQQVIEEAEADLIGA